MALRRSVAWSLLVTLMASGTALAQEAPEWADDRSVSGREVVDWMDDLESYVGYGFAWPDTCATPEGHVSSRDGEASLRSMDIALCQEARAALGSLHPFAPVEAGMAVMSVAAGPATSEAETSNRSSDGPLLEGSGEAWASPARGQGQLRTGAGLQLDGVAAAHAQVDASLGDADAASPNGLPSPQAAPDLDAPLPLFPPYEPAPAWTHEETVSARLAPSEVRGIEVDHAAPTELQSAASRVRAGIAGSVIQGERVVAAGLLLLAVGFALYQRISPSRSIEHEARALIRQTLMEHPEGATAGDVGRLLGMNRKTAEYHLTYLARLGTLRTGLDEHGARLYSLKAVPPRQTVVERMLLLVRERPGLSVPEAALALGVSRSSADRHAKALVVSGALESRLSGGERKLYERVE